VLFILKYNNNNLLYRVPSVLQNLQAFVNCELNSDIRMSECKTLKQNRSTITCFLKQTIFPSSISWHQNQNSSKRRIWIDKLH